FHRREWVCVHGCLKTFRSQFDFKNHLEVNHSNLYEDPLRSTLIDACERQIPPDASDKCPFCSCPLLSRNDIRDHLGREQAHLALRALPLSEQDSDSSETNSHAVELPSSDDGELSRGQNLLEQLQGDSQHTRPMDKENAHEQ